MCFNDPEHAPHVVLRTEIIFGKFESQSTHPFQTYTVQ